MVERLLEVYDIQAGRWGRGDILDPKLAVLWVGFGERKGQAGIRRSRGVVRVGQKVEKGERYGRPVQPPRGGFEGKGRLTSPDMDE